MELIEVNSNNINYLQRTVSEIRVFDVNKYEPIRVMYADGQLVSYDNRRLISVQNAQLDKLKVDLVNENDIMPVSKKTWKKHFKKRFEAPRNIEAGGIVP